MRRYQAERRQRKKAQGVAALLWMAAAVLLFLAWAGKAAAGEVPPAGETPGGGELEEGGEELPGERTWEIVWVKENGEIREDREETRYTSQREFQVEFLLAAEEEPLPGAVRAVIMAAEESGQDSGEQDSGEQDGGQDSGGQDDGGQGSGGQDGGQGGGEQDGGQSGGEQDSSEEKPEEEGEEPEGAVLDEIAWEAWGEGEWLGSFSIQAPEDRSFWFVLEAGEDAYESGRWRFDGEAPEIRIFLGDEPWPEDGVFAREEAVTLRAEVRDAHIDPAEAQIWLRRLEPDGQEWEEQRISFLADEKEEGLLSASCVLQAEGQYVLTAEARDRAGNESAQEAAAVLDRTPPALSGQEMWAAGKAVLPDQVGQEQWYYADGEARIQVSLGDSGAGAARARLYYQAETGDRWTVLADTGEEGLPAQSSQLSGVLEAPGSGWIGLWAVDRCGNELGSEEEPERLFAVRLEDGQAHGSHAGADIRPLQEAGMGGFYTGDVELEIRLWDNGCGIRRMSVTGGGELLASYVREDGEEPQKAAVQRIFLRVPPDFEGSLLVEAEGEDMAGNAITASREFQADTKAPEGELVFEAGEPREGIYYREPRRAVARVRDANFDPEASALEMEGAEAGPWMPAGENVYEAQITFARDGRYEPVFSCADRAGNRCTVGTGEAFVIDQTPPRIRAAMEPAAGDGEYYREEVRFLVEVEEAYPKEEAFSWTLYRDGQEVDFTPPAFSWDGAGGRAAVSFPEEGQYQWELQARDRAGNVSRAYVSPAYVQDFTPPVLEWEGVEAFGSYRGDFAPSVSAADPFLQDKGLSVSLTLAGGEEIRLPAREEQGDGWAEHCYEAWPKVRELDGVYELAVSATDQAGNETEETLLFTVNRFGSSFTVSPEGRALEEKYYVNQMPAWSVTENNVSQVLQRRVLVSCGGETEEWKEGEQYQVRQMQGSQGRQEYQYLFAAGSPGKDGPYRIAVRTRDAAGNFSEMEELSFFLDTQPPSVLLSGVEEGGSYSGGSREIFIDVQDEGGTESLRILLNGEEAGSYTAEEIEEAAGVFRLRIQGLDGLCTLSVEAADRAGNTAEEAVRFVTGAGREARSQDGNGQQDRDSTLAGQAAGTEGKEEEGRTDHGVQAALAAAVLASLLGGAALAAAIAKRRR